MLSKINEIAFQALLYLGALFFLIKTAEVLIRILKNGERMDRELLIYYFHIPIIMVGFGFLFKFINYCSAYIHAPTDAPIPIWPVFGYLILNTVLLITGLSHNNVPNERALAREKEELKREKQQQTKTISHPEPEKKPRTAGNEKPGTDQSKPKHLYTKQGVSKIKLTKQERQRETAVSTGVEEIRYALRFFKDFDTSAHAIKNQQLAKAAMKLAYPDFEKYYPKNLRWPWNNMNVPIQGGNYQLKLALAGGFLCTEFNRINRRNLTDENILNLVLKERIKQVYDKGYDADHDDKLKRGELSRAAFCYAEPNKRYREDVFAGKKQLKTVPNKAWPWKQNKWDSYPRSRNRELVIAIALIAAEIEREERTESASRAKEDNENTTQKGQHEKI